MVRFKLRHSWSDGHAASPGRLRHLGVASPSMVAAESTGVTAQSAYARYERGCMVGKETWQWMKSRPSMGTTNAPILVRSTYHAKEIARSSLLDILYYPA